MIAKGSGLLLESFSEGCVDLKYLAFMSTSSPILKSDRVDLLASAGPW